MPGKLERVMACKTDADDLPPGMVAIDLTQRPRIERLQGALEFARAFNDRLPEEEQIPTDGLERAIAAELAKQN